MWIQVSVLSTEHVCGTQPGSAAIKTDTGPKQQKSPKEILNLGTKELNSPSLSFFFFFNFLYLMSHQILKTKVEFPDFADHLKA